MSRREQRRQHLWDPTIWCFITFHFGCNIYIYIYKIFQQSHYRLHIVMSTSKCYQGSIYFVNILTVGQKGERNVLQIHHLTTPTLQFFFFNTTLL